MSQVYEKLFRKIHSQAILFNPCEIRHYVRSRDLLLNWNLPQFFDKDFAVLVAVFRLFLNTFRR